MTTEARGNWKTLVNTEHRIIVAAMEARKYVWAFTGKKEKRKAKGQGPYEKTV